MLKYKLNIQVYLNYCGIIKNLRALQFQHIFIHCPKQHFEYSQSMFINS